MAIDFKKSISDPYSVDTGNKTTQGMTVSKTIKFGLFTTNENAVWGARNQLQKESFPFAVASILVNRDMFRIQVGDAFKYQYLPYSTEILIMRAMQIEEEDLEGSENIIIHARQDVFSITNKIELYSAPVDNAGQGADYSVDPFVDQAIFEAPWVLSEETRIIPVASRLTELITGFSVYMSTDAGVSYNLLTTSNNVQPYGTLNTDYGLTYAFDDETGILIDFVSDVDSIENVTFSDILSGSKNMAILGDEIISFQNITPISGDIYYLENVIRGRWGTVQKEHAAGEDFWFIPKSVNLISDSNIATGADRKFKLVPFNNQAVGSLVAATPIDITIEGESSKPYEPNNFYANGESFNSSYVSGADITLTWSPRVRGAGAGSIISGVPVETNTDHEGLFRIEVFVSAVKVRDTSDIDSITWDYTNAMNIEDNGTPAETITFILYNYLVYNGIKYESDGVTVICNKE